MLRPDELTCPGDRMPATFVEVLVVPRACALGATTACLTACTARDTAACLSAADTMAHGWTLAAQRMYRLACAAGSAEGCLREEALRVATLGPEETACASRVHAHLCTAGYQAACALLPRPAPPE